jgi:hypothetical protein
MQGLHDDEIAEEQTGSGFPAIRPESSRALRGCSKKLMAISVAGGLRKRLPAAASLTAWARSLAVRREDSRQQSQREHAGPKADSGPLVFVREAHEAYGCL